MTKYLIIILVVFAPLLSGADEKSALEFEPYLGLAVPYPEHEFQDTLNQINMKIPRGRKISVTLDIDKKGKIKNILYDNDSADYILPLAKELKKIRFDFTPGRKIKELISVPAFVFFRRVALNGILAEAKFPVSSKIESDSLLLRKFFEANDISPPVIKYIPPIFYRVYPEKDSRDYLTITALIRLDTAGTLFNISFPLPGQDLMTHRIYMSMLNSQFQPPTIAGEVLACQIFITFRIFDNIKYPFDPLAGGDTLTPQITEKYFMTQYYNANDISLPPMPRKYPSGYIRTAKYGRQGLGFAEARISIDVNGYVRRVSVATAPPGMDGIISEVARLTTWYPAVNNKGQRVEFSGKISFNFEASNQIRYSTDWLDFGH